MCVFCCNCICKYILFVIFFQSWGYSYYLIVFFCIMTSSVVFFVSHAGATSFTNHLKILLISIRIVMNLLSPIPNICWNILKWFAFSYFWTTTIFVVHLYMVLNVLQSVFLLISLQWFDYHQGISVYSCIAIEKNMIYECF